MPSHNTNAPVTDPGAGPRGNRLMEPFFFLALIGLWFALQMWILPMMGFNT